MIKIPNVRVVFQQWTNVWDKRFPNYIKTSRGKPSEKDDNSLKRFKDNSTYVRIKGQIRVYISTKIYDDRNITKMKSFQQITSGINSSFIANR